ncbi:paralemmin-3 [Anolis sagrei]|uniref:paralemmin-3 n=1 Tax=Anolis sagrei TaxID=38937 RepID=UPI00352052AD
MAESSLFAQRLQAIMERRRLQERILATRRELEEERLRAQRLKRKSLRDRWLMEGMSAPTDDGDHVSSVWEAQTRIQELEDDLSSLQSQMQQLDNPELQQPEEPAKAVKETKQSSLDGTAEVPLISSSSPQGRNSPESRLELAPVPPERPEKEAAKEKLQNGDMSGDDVFGGECSPEQVDDKVNPVVVESGDLQSHQDSSEGSPATKPPLQSPNLTEAAPSHHRKLAVEEMVIRDHLGQEVGSMDAVGQKQSSIVKEDENEEPAPLKNGCEERNEPAPLCDDLGQEMSPTALGSQLDGELGSREGPEGESPTSQDEHQQTSSKQGQDVTSCLDSSKQQADGEPGKETALMGAGQTELPGQGASEVEPTQDPAASDALAANSITSGLSTQENKKEPQASHEAEIPVLGQEGEGLSTEPPFPDQTSPVPEASSEEDKLSSSPVEQIALGAQNLIPSLQDTEGSLLDQIPSSLQEMEGPLLDPVVLSLPNQSPSDLLSQGAPALQETEGPLVAQISPSVQEPILDPIPPSLQDSFPSSSEQKAPSSQGAATALQEAKHSSLDQIPSPVHETNGACLDQIPTSLQSTSLPDQILSPPSDQFASLSDDIPSTLHEKERSSQISSTLESQESSVMEVKDAFPDITSSLPNPLSSLPDQVSPLQDAEGLTLKDIQIELEHQTTTAPETQISSLPEADSILQGQAPSSVGGDEHLVPKETPVSGPDQVLQVQTWPFVEGQALSSLPEVGESSAEESQEPLPSQTLPSLPEAKKSLPGEAQIVLEELMPTSAQDQPSLGEVTKTVSEKEMVPSDVEKIPALPDQTPSLKQGPNATLQDISNVPDVLLSSSQEHAQSILVKTAPMANQEVKGGGDAALSSEETPEVLGDLHAEQQPLLNSTNASVAPPEISLGDPQLSKTGILKSQAAPSQETPTYTTASANTASSRQLQPAGSRQEEGEDQGQSRRKQKSCQCCSVM